MATMRNRQHAGGGQLTTEQHDHSFSVFIEIGGSRHQVKVTMTFEVLARVVGVGVYVERTVLSRQLVKAVCASVGAERPCRWLAGQSPAVLEHVFRYAPGRLRQLRAAGEVI